MKNMLATVLPVFVIYSLGEKMDKNQKISYKGVWRVSDNCVCNAKFKILPSWRSFQRDAVSFQAVAHSGHSLLQTACM
jgi:hypothetical protein